MGKKWDRKCRPWGTLGELEKRYERLKAVHASYRRLRDELHELLNLRGLRFELLIGKWATRADRELPEVDEVPVSLRAFLVGLLRKYRVPEYVEPDTRKIGSRARPPAPTRVWGTPRERALTAREMAYITILIGVAPSPQPGLTPMHVIRREANAIAMILSRTKEPSLYSDD